MISIVFSKGKRDITGSSSSSSVVLLLLLLLLIDAAAPRTTTWRFPVNSIEHYEMSLCFNMFIILAAYRVDRNMTVSLQMNDVIENYLCIQMHLAKTVGRSVFKFLLDAPRWLPGRIMASIPSSLNTSHKEVGGVILWLLYLMYAIICNLSKANMFLT